MLPIFCAFSASWSDQIMAAVSYIALDKLGVKYKTAMSKIFIASGDYDLAARPWLTSAWMNYVERPPFNFKGFNHWHIMREDYNPENLTIPDYQNEDTLLSNLNEMNDSLIVGKAKTSWPVSMCLKVLFAGIPDLHAPLHLIEYFSSDFKDGDRNGKLFKVNANGKETNLFDFYETGCGLTPLTSTIDDKFLTEVKELVDSVMERYSFKTETITDSSFKEWHDKNVKDAKSIYNKIKPGHTFSETEISKCQSDMLLSIIRSAQRIFSYVKLTSILDFAESLSDQEISQPGVQIATSEAMAWSLAAILAPFTALLIWRKHCAKL